MAKSHNSQFPNLGTEDKKFCDGVEKIGVYKIYPTGAIFVVYRALDDRLISSISTDSCNSLSSPFRELCKVAKAFGDIVVAMKDKELNPSQKYVVLKDMVRTNSFDEFNSEMITKLSRLESMPLLKSTAFGIPFIKAQKRYACSQPVQTSLSGGRPILLPLFRACFIPRRVRSRIKASSNPENAEKI